MLPYVCLLMNPAHGQNAGQKPMIVESHSQRETVDPRIERAGGSEILAVFPADAQVLSVTLHFIVGKAVQ